MLRYRPTLAVLLITLSTLAHADSVAPISGADHEAAVRAFVEASNRHDVDHMVGAVDADFRWMQIEGDRVITEVVGAEQLRSWLSGYFHSTPDARSSIGPTLSDGRYVSAVETVSYRDAKGIMQQQAATSIYEFGDDGRIRAAWYFPAQTLGQPSPAVTDTARETVPSPDPALPDAASEHTD